MKETKITRKSSIGQTKNSQNKWKDKALLRREEIARLRKRNKELLASRDAWKSKYKELKTAWQNLPILSSDCAYRHHYSLPMVVLVVGLYSYGGMSLRSCRHSLCCMLVGFGMSASVPSHGTIRNWLCKCGRYRVERRNKEVYSYVLYIDESISFGSEKILLILGVDSDAIPKGRSLKHEDMDVLFVGASTEWKGTQITQELSRLRQHHKLSYVVSDQGNNLRKAYKSVDCEHIPDVTHIAANALKRIYDKDEIFEAFRKMIAKLRRDWNLSKSKSQYMPPTMRGKMRFANIFPCINWAKKMLATWEDLPEQVQHALQFLKTQHEFIASLIQIQDVFKMLCATLKNKGFGTAQKKEILTYFESIEAQEKTAIFMRDCEQYLDNLSLKAQKLELDFLLCSSDIIESFFGKFKFKRNPNARSGLTEFIFTIATFGKPFSEKEAKAALESITCKDLRRLKTNLKKR